jgi:hypothetical protein
MDEALKYFLGFTQVARMLWGGPSFCVVCRPTGAPQPKQTTKTDRLPHGTV